MSNYRITPLDNIKAKAYTANTHYTENSNALIGILTFILIIGISIFFII